MKVKVKGTMEARLENLATAEEATNDVLDFFCFDVRITFFEIQV